MEKTVVSLGKSVLDGALNYAKSAIAEEVSLQLGIDEDHRFVVDELEMMRSFMMEAHEEKDRSKVVNTWIRQVRDTAYNVEDSLQDFAVHLERPHWWRFPCTLIERHRVAKQMKQLRAKVEEVSQRNVRYRLINESGSRAIAANQSNTIVSTMFGIDDARLAAKQDNLRVDLVELINEEIEDEDLKVIAVWGTSGNIGQTSVIRVAYENPGIQNNFPVRAWARIMHPFNPKDFIQNLVSQFHATEGVEALLEAEKPEQSLVQEFNGFVKENKFLIVLSDISTIEEWDRIKKCFQNNKKGSRIVVSTTQVEVASLCVGQESQVSELKQLSADQTLYAFYDDKGSQNVKDSVKPVCSTSESDDEITEVQPMDAGKKVARKNPTRTRSNFGNLESQLIGRTKQVTEIIDLLLNKDSQQCQVISVWGMGGIGKTTLVSGIYESPDLRDTFEKCVFITVTRPFNLAELLRSLAMRLHDSHSYKKEKFIENRVGKGSIASMRFEELTDQLKDLLENMSCMIVLDDLSSITEWDMIKPLFRWMKKTSRIIVTTREQNIANHCSGRDGTVYNIQALEPEDALDLFSEKVFGDAAYLAQQKDPQLTKEAKQILKKCGRLPLAIVVIGGYLANRPKASEEWRRLNENISAELEMNPELGTIKTVLEKSYDGLPYDLKSCFLYLSIFPEDQIISRRRLVRRWAAEGYSAERRGKSVIDMADSYFMELYNRSMILPFQKSVDSRKSMDHCKVHDLLREISIMKSLQEDMVFTLEEGSNLKAAARHLAISSDWNGSQCEFESSVDLAQLRSLTVFGKFRSFFISEKMHVLRVLDLEHTRGLFYHGLDHIGKLLHLKYLSLRGCRDVRLLPDSLGNLRQLQTLDIRDTNIIALPKTIVKLQKLQYIHAGRKSEAAVQEPGLAMRCERFLWEVPKLCAACCVPSLMRLEDFDEDFERCDVPSACCNISPTCAKGFVDEGNGAWLPRGIRKLKGLLTLRAVNVGRGNAVLQDIRWLTGLHKLGVTGINKKNALAFCLAISNLRKLESLSVHAARGRSGLRGCLDAVHTPPENLQSLKLYGNLEIFPEWIKMLQHLVKLKLGGTGLLDNGLAMDFLGKLPNLEILGLSGLCFLGEHLCFHSQQSEIAFGSIRVLRFADIRVKTVEFEVGAMPKLEQLEVTGEVDNEISFSGLEYLPSIKEVHLSPRFHWNYERFSGLRDSEINKVAEEEMQEQKRKVDELRKKIQEQLSRNPKHPILM